MLSFNKLGKSGRLGNQMFQYAALRGIAANRGLTGLFHLQAHQVLMSLVVRTTTVCLKHSR